MEWNERKNPEKARLKIGKLQQAHTKLKWIHLMTMHFNRHLKSNSSYSELFGADKEEREGEKET